MPQVSGVSYGGIPVSVGLRHRSAVWPATWWSMQKRYVGRVSEAKKSSTKIQSRDRKTRDLVMEVIQIVWGIPIFGVALPISKTFGHDAVRVHIRLQWWKVTKEHNHVPGLMINGYQGISHNLSPFFWIASYWICFLPGPISIVGKYTIFIDSVYIYIWWW